MCGVDWQHEFNDCTLVLYTTEEALRGARTCIHQCGAVKVKVTAEVLEWIQPQDFGNLIPEKKK